MSTTKKVLLGLLFLISIVFFVEYNKPPPVLTVDNAINKAEQILNAPSYGLMKQIAKVESNYGKAEGTYDGTGGCGIWQVDRIALRDTQDTESHPGLVYAHWLILHSLDLDWNTITCNDLDYPLLGALAARLYLMNKPVPIPESLEERALYWKEYYNTSKGSGTTEHFIRENR